MTERLQKTIAQAGIASRRHAEALIVEGVVSVNGAVVTTLGTKVDPARDHVKVHGKRIAPQTRSVYLLLNKPKGYITSANDPQGRPTVMDLVVGVTERVYPVGRLDYASEGLLLLTNDGELAQKLMHPRHEVEKRYWVKVSGHLTEAKLQKVAAGGISIPTGRTASCQVQRLNETEGYSWLEVTLHEGKNREIRKVMEKIGHPVNKLKRVGYAFLKIGNMSPGAYRHLTSEEVTRLQKQVDQEGHSQGSVVSKSADRDQARRPARVPFSREVGVSTQERRTFKERRLDQRSVASGQRSVVSGQRSVASDQVRKPVRDQRSVVSDQGRKPVRDQRSVVSDQGRKPVRDQRSVASDQVRKPTRPPFGKREDRGRGPAVRDQRSVASDQVRKPARPPFGKREDRGRGPAVRDQRSVANDQVRKPIRPPFGKMPARAKTRKPSHGTRNPHK